MAFSEYIKKDVMQKAGFCCCVCHRPSVSVEVHHIIPLSEGGDDTIENAAPLCPSCHSDYGGNEEKRNRIKQMRDWWYKTVEQMYSGNIAGPEQLHKIHDILQNVNAKQDSILKRQQRHDSDLHELKVQLKTISNNAIDRMTMVNSDITTSAVLGTAVSSIMSFGDPDLQCMRCKSFIDARHKFCPNCGYYMG